MQGLNATAGKPGALVLLAALLLSGCTNNPNPVAWNQEETFYQVTADEPVSYDPSISYNAADAPVMDPIYPSYYRYNYLKQNPWSLELNLGLREPVRDPVSGTLHTDKGETPFKGDRWTFEIRHDIHFQDDPCFPGGKGRNVTARDLEFSFKRMADPRIEFPLASNLADKLIGWDSYKKGFAKGGDPADDPNYDRPLEGFQLDPTNPYRFSVTFNQPYPQFRYLMVMHFTTPIPREAVKSYRGAFAIDRPVGCGPYRMEEYIPHQRIVLVRNPNNSFWRFPTSARPGTSPELLAEEGKPIPLAKRLVYSIVLEQVTSYNLFEQGYLDTWGIAAGNAQFMLSAVRPGATMTERGVRMLKGAYPSIAYCGFNMEDPTFGGYTPEKRKLRQAISLSIDSDAYVDLIDQGLAKKAEFALPGGLCGYDPNYKNPYRIYDPSLKKAKQLLAEAGYPGGIDPKTHQPLTITLENITQNPSDRLRARFLSKEIESIGLKVDVEAENYPTFSDKVKHTKAQFYDWGWIADYPDAENFLMLLNGANAPDPNNTNYKNEDYDRLFNQVRSMDDGPQREVLIKQMRDIAVEDCPWIFLAEDEAPTAFQPWVLNKESNPILSDISNYRGIDAAKRAQLQHQWNPPVLAPLAIVGAAVIFGVAPAIATVRRQRNRRVRRPADEGPQGR